MKAEIDAWLARLPPSTRAAVAADKNALAVMAAHLAPPPPKPASPTPAAAPSAFSKAEVRVIAECLLGSPNPALSSGDVERYGPGGHISVDLASARFHDSDCAHSGSLVELVTRMKSLPDDEAKAWVQAQTRRRSLPLA